MKMLHLVVGVLALVLMPLTAAAEAAARPQTANNLKQIGVGVHDPRVERLNRLQTTPSMKCAKIEYYYGCLSGDPWKLTRVYCRSGATEASCCKGARELVTKTCTPAWDAAKKSGKFWSPGPFVCKCIQAGSTGLRKVPKRTLKRLPQ